MAKKVVAQESCLFCGESPCTCDDGSVLRSTALRRKHARRPNEGPLENDDEAEATDQA